MEPLAAMPRSARAAVRAVLTDLDDTLTTGGRLPAAAYGALERLREGGLGVAVVTGRPAGWCDHIARMWPVDGVVGENGALYFRYRAPARRMERWYARNADERARDRARLEALARRILAEVPGCAIAADQPWRESDLAIDYREDVPDLGPAAAERIAEICRDAGAQAKVSSIHVNAWFGDHDKLATSRVLARAALGIDLDAERDRVVFAGDSPNDAPMFAHFPNAVGVANVRRFAGRLGHEPAWVTPSAGGAGFAELAEALLAARAGADAD